MKGDSTPAPDAASAAAGTSRAGAESGMAPAYDPKPIESRIYQRWLDADAFRAGSGRPGTNRTPFSIVIPPPNVTGALHMGHALNNILQDAVIRHRRMLGDDCLWVPGTDHAGIATQHVVERALFEETGQRKGDLGREKFVERVWTWKKKYGERILSQLERLGSSCDWSRTRFTMDEGLSKAVREVFVSLHEQGLVYRANYLINWCATCGTALANDEVEYEEQPGNLWQLKYDVIDPAPGGPTFVIVATTRPETMLGDTAVAVHPEDPRYLSLHGKTVRLPLVGRTLRVITDTAVQREFGTGCLKVTPGHDPVDFDLGRKHGLETVSIFDKFAVVNEAGGQYRGLSAADARKAVLADLATEGRLVKTEAYTLNAGACYRCATRVEPMISLQWFVKMKPLAEAATAAVEGGKIEFTPKKWERVYFEWMKNIRDWCISRQLWWGHRIPVWYCADCHKETVSRLDPTACAHCQSVRIEQDPDVLDTWFSSWLWPFSTMGWPAPEAEAPGSDLSRYYPTAVLITGFDIIFFWVARMIMAGLAFKKDVPFRKVYISVLVRDEQGRKMSKSLGNVIDPIDVIDTHGADALRFAIVRSAITSADILFSEGTLDGARHFANKIWNAARFTLSNLGTETPGELSDPDIAGALALEDRFLLSRLAAASEDVATAWDEYDFPRVARTLYDFVWTDLCDKYLEMAKPSLRSPDPARARAVRAVLYETFVHTLRLLHPVMPFETEEIRSKFPRRAGTPDLLMFEPYPTAATLAAGLPFAVDATSRARLEAEMKPLLEIVAAARQMRAESVVPPGKKVPLLLAVRDAKTAARIEENAGWMAALIQSSGFAIAASHEKPAGAAAGAVILDDPAIPDEARRIEIVMPLADVVDLGRERERVERELQKIRSEIDKTKKKLENANFIARAPKDVVEKEREKISKYDKMRESLEESLRAFLPPVPAK